MTQTLLALLAPGSVEAEVGRVQQAIFAEHGLVSSIALPSLMPVAFLASDEPRRGLLAELNAAVAAPYRIVFTGLSWQEGWLYLGVDSGGAWLSLRAAALAAFAHETGGKPGLFPAFEGFFLGCAEAQAEHRGLIRPSLPAGGFTSSVLSLMRIDAAGAGGAWWREVSTEILEELPLRGRRRS
ncbi:MAG: hypothetical protein ABSG38_08870 [Spirochaetia bacterium]|jgi:hypothetical protein